MKELDLLKKDWQKSENAFNQITEQEIYKMIHKKSSSIVKWIFIISVMEVLFWITASLLLNSDEFIKDNISYSKFKIVLTIIDIINYSIILIFIFLFYKNSKTISATDSVKSLMQSILKTRRIVQYYVWYNLSMFFICMFFGSFIGVMYNTNIDKKIDDPMVYCLIFGLIFLFIIILGVAFWGVYRLIYGRLLRRLNANYNELKKMNL